MNRLFWIFCLMLGQQVLVYAQPQPCDINNPEMTSTCGEACIICDINGFTGRHNGTEDGEAPPGFEGDCTQKVHNMQWIAFIAGSTNLSVSLEVSNCDLFLGLEFGLYKGIDCGDFQRISNCFGGANSIPPGRSGTIENSEPLVVGQYYYIVMDGSREDRCDWTFSVVEGSTTAAELVEPSPIEGDFSPCQSETVTYSTEPQSGSTLFDWTLNGAQIGDFNVPSVEVTFDMPGNYTLCLTPQNACTIASTTCEQINIKANPVTEINDEFCEEGCYEIAGGEVCETGNYNFVLTSEEGCDSIINASLTELQTAMTQISATICVDDTLVAAGMEYTLPGTYNLSIQDSNGCDSIIVISLNTVICNINAEGTAIDLSCFGENDGMINFTVTGGDAPFNYTWERLGDNVTSGSGSIADLNETSTINSLLVGTYLITIEDGVRNVDVLIVDVLEPLPLVVDIVAVDYNGFSTSCFSSEDGMLSSVVQGGTAPYTYRWNNNEISSSLSGIGAGNYNLVVTDVQGCTAETTYTVTSPLALSLETVATNSSCEGLETGLIQVQATEGGVAPFEYSLASQAFSSEILYSNLGPGSYELVVRDSNGCTLSRVETLNAPEIPVVELGADREVCLGDSLLVEAMLNAVSIADYSWASDDEVHCPTCLSTYILPRNTQQLRLTVSSEDGCTADDEINITVIKNREFYAPNIMDLSESGDNQYFTLFSSKGVLSYDLRVFDRWGNLLFEGKDMKGETASEGWDGRYKNDEVRPGVFVWTADMIFLDQEVLTLSGQLTVIK